MKSLKEKEEMFNRFYNDELTKSELALLIKRLLLDKEWMEWFTIQMEFKAILSDPQLSIHN
jgi:hypothetical protein